MKINLSHSAFNDLENVIEYYNDEGAPHIGQRFAEDIMEHIQVLSVHPELGRMVPEFQLPHIRELIHAPFRVIYLHEKSAVTVIRIWRSERLLVLPTENT